LKKSSTLRRLALALLPLCFVAQVQASDAVQIRLVNNSVAEQQTRTQLLGLLSKHDVSKWLFTRNIAIEGGEIPHSHPELTLNTRHLKHSDLLLSTFVHEQIHWFLEQHEAPAKAAMDELRVLYPRIPVGYPEGASDEEANYEHLIVIYLEYQAVKELLGQSRARKVMDDWARDHYTWLVKKVVRDEARIKTIVQKHGLTL
jgi:hypothetical protein